MSRTTITPTIISKCKELASRGLNNIMIAKSLNLAYSTLSKNRKVVKAIQEGRAELAEKIIDNVLNNLDDTQTRLYIAKRLNLFNPAINIKKPTNAKEALENLSNAMKQYADGEINESQLRTIEAVSNSFIKGVEFMEFEKRLQELENEIRLKEEN